MSKNNTKAAQAPIKNITSIKNTIVEQLPSEIWLEIFQHLHIYDFIFFGSCCKDVRRLVRKIKPFGPTFVFDQTKFVEYLALNGYASCLEYAMSFISDIDFTHLAKQVAAFGKTQNHIDVLKLCEKQGLECDMAKLVKDCAAHQCNFAMLKYLTTSAFTTQAKNILLYNSFDWPSTDVPAERGHFDCMKLLMELGFERKMMTYTTSMKCWDYFLSQKYRWASKNDASFVTKAAKEGDLRMLKLAIANGAPMPREFIDVKTVECIRYILENTNSKIRSVTNFIENNKLEAVEFFILHGYIPKMTYLLEAKAIGASKEMHQLLAKVPFDKYSTEYNPATMIIRTLPSYGVLESPYVALIEKNNIDTMIWALEKWPLDVTQAQNCLQRAIFYTRDHDENDGDIDIVRLFVEKFKLDVNKATDQAVKFGSVKVLKFFTEKGANWSTKHIISASENRRFASLVYFHKIGLPWTADVCNRAGSLLCLKYAREHGCPWTKEFWPNLFQNLQYKDIEREYRVKYSVNIPMFRYAVWNNCPMDELTREDVKFMIKQHPSLNIRFNTTK